MKPVWVALKTIKKPLKPVANAFEKPFGNPSETWFQGVSNRLETVWKLVRNPFETF